MQYYEGEGKAQAQLVICDLSLGYNLSGGYMTHIRSLQMVHIFWLLNSSSKNLFQISHHEIMQIFSSKDIPGSQFFN